jgi:dTDP-4-dehydrorhamnose reductase
MKILLTGANGLVGQKIKAGLAGMPQVQLTATSLHPEIHPLDRDYRFETLDITSATHLKDVVARHQPDVIINAAAQANVNACEQNRILCRQVNTEAVMDITHIANRYGIHLVQISTDFVFSGLKTNYSEEDNPDPLNYYGMAKKEAEDYIMEHARQWSIIRTILVYGHVPELNRQNLVTWVYHSLKNGRPINVVHDQYRTPTLAEDLALACSQIALHAEEGIFHIAGREMMSVEQIARQVAEHFRLDAGLITPVSSAWLNEPAMRPPRSGFNLMKAEKTLGFIPHSFQEGLTTLERQLHHN